MVSCRRFVSRRVLLTGLGVVFLGWSCGSGGPVDPPEPLPLGTIVGRITLGESGWGGTVDLCAEGGSPCRAPVTTAMSGLYEFTNLAPGRYNLVAEPRARVTRSPTFVEHITCEPQVVTVPSGATVRADIPCLTDNPAGIGWGDY